ncbi:MAG: Lrp/AsnC family transcriptional regulator [Actinomycetia bacterium]|nr:Lrp/AsnC family transcriptional regulator [Actinomycetes bacterium]
MLDGLDRRIIAALIDDGRSSIRELAEKVSLSASATSDRVRKLEANGAIAGYAAILDLEPVGRPLQAIVDVQLDPGSGQYDIDDAIRAMPLVVDAIHLTGRFDYQLRVACTGMGDVEEVIRHLKQGLGVRETSTRMVLRAVDGTPRQPRWTRAGLEPGQPPRDLGGCAGEAWSTSTGPSCGPPRPAPPGSCIPSCGGGRPRRRWVGR